MLHVERMHLPGPTPVDRVETLLESAVEGALLAIRMTLPDAESFKATLATGKAEGMKTNYKRLDESCN